MRLVGSATLVIACVGSTARAQRMIFPDDSSTTRRFRSVTLAIEVTPDHFAARDTVHITFHVTNDGGAGVTFCVGRGYGIELATAFDTVRTASLVDQESCAGGPHTLDPGFSLAWDRFLVIPPVRSGGSAVLNAWADILDPLDCRVYGCGRAVTKTPGVAVQIVAPRSP
jgi:hypothetical protein